MRKASFQAWVTALALLPLAPTPLLAGPVEVRTRLLPEKTVVHSPLELRIEVTHPTWARPRWEPPHFEGFWPERLSTQGETIDSHSVLLRRTVFRRALYPTRPGRLGIPPSVLRYQDPDGTKQTLPVAGAEVRVDPLPMAGRPPGFGGVVGEAEIQAEFIRNPVVRGESVRLLVDVFGHANLWNLEASALRVGFEPDFEVFPARPRLHVGEHENRITVRRTLVWDLVPVREGALEIPAIEIPYFDPRRSQYRMARSTPLRLQVVGAASQLGSRSPFYRRPATAPPGWGGGRALLLGILACGAAALFLLRWARRNAELLRRPSRPSPKAALEAARAHLGSEEFPRLLADAVRAGIAVRHRIEVAGLTSEEIAARVDDPEALGLLARVDRIRFARDPTPADSLLASVARYLSD
jgi:hypothetical protein